MPLLDDFLAKVPAESRPHVRRLLDGAPEAVPALHAKVSAYLAECRTRSSDNEFLDLILAEAIGHTLLALAAALEGAHRDAQIVLTAAARYYVEADDGDHDFDSLIGFEDDAWVVVAACRALGHDALAAPLVEVLPA